MYHVRFLKVPYSKCSLSLLKSDSPKKSRTKLNDGKAVTAPQIISRPQAFSGSTCTINSVVTLTTDLGEYFFYGNATLSVSLIASGQLSSKTTNVIHTKVQWKPGMRALPIELEVSMKQLDRIMKNRGVDVRFYMRVGLNIDGESNDENEIYVDSYGDTLSTVLPVTSLGFWFSGAEEWRPRKYDIQWTIRYDNDNQRYVSRDIPIGVTSLKLVEETGESVARHLWDSGILLGSFLTSSQNNRDLFVQQLRAASKPMRILELGSGCGTVGLSLSKVFPQSHVVLTDLDSARDVCERNIALNCTTNKSSRANGKVEFSSFNWDSGNNTAEENAKVYDAEWDLVISCDCTYNADSFDILTDVLLKVVSRRTKLLLVHKERHGSEARVFELLREKNNLHFQWRQQLGPASVKSTADILVRWDNE
ncbi:putative methyltransferase-domain-containing protein [Lipomyces tetrasporus]|uniref:Methyltransferase-domain-containing protein n=1 Tax=Lipomyces tetrasporus TaxID=54092 RepID=A0AAD7QKB1_9ASCO|nr:putative methyltransferase-domain-containing protein [Lipomyces tetrasporus]KAJ8096837.1 putative methyltransferase-domain-containing protein [Lipomyces tetrasporus]